MTKSKNKDDAMKNILALLLGSLIGTSAMAALPPLTPEQAEAAALAKAKTAYGDRVGAYQLCQAQNRVADRYRVAGAPAPAACVAPPPFVPPAAK
jgi:predicted lipid-binding transport protein (Tim44 family)